MTATPRAQPAIAYAQLTDTEVAALCARRDAGALRLLVTAHNQRLFRAAWSVLKNRLEAEEVVQASYAKAIAAIGSFEGRSSLATWLTRITLNEALGRRRAQRRRQKYLEAEGVSVLEQYREQLANGSTASTPEAEAAREQLRLMLEAAVAQLPDAFRITFVLHEIEGLPVDEVAETLGVPVGTVKTRLMRARLKLREALAPEVRSVLSGTFPFAGNDCARLTERVLHALGVPHEER